MGEVRQASGWQGPHRRSLQTWQDGGLWEANWAMAWERLVGPETCS